jgi:hypothetical protein
MENRGKKCPDLGGGTTIPQFSEGKIVEDWTNFDALGLMQQLGLIPEQ